jgi:hypothetical protein
VISNRNPSITLLTAKPKRLDLNASSVLHCTAADPDGDSLEYHWTAPIGSFTGQGSSVTWSAPSSAGHYFIVCRIDDGHGGEGIDSIGVVVQDFSNMGTGVPILYFPFNGNADDESGFGNHGTVYGAAPVSDRFGDLNSAYSFDGVNDHIRVSNCPLLNFQDAISVSFWMSIDAFFSREAYPISHGNWDNRWKLSILPDKHIRWTVKTDNPSNSGIKDLDSKMVFEKKLVVHIVAVYDGSIVSIFINNQLDNSGSWSGLLLTTTFDLTIGQVLPNNSQYNFKGILDDVRIFDYALSSEEIQNLYQEQSSSVVEGRLGLPGSLFLEPNFPNPFNDKTAIRYRLDSRGRVLLTVYNLLGKPVRKLLDAEMAPGSHMIWWDGRDDGNLSVSTGMYVCTIKTVGFSDRIKILYIK